MERYIWAILKDWSCWTNSSCIILCGRFRHSAFSRNCYESSNVFNLVDKLNTSFFRITVSKVFLRFLNFLVYGLQETQNWVLSVCSQQPNFTTFFWFCQFQFSGIHKCYKWFVITLVRSGHKTRNEGKMWVYKGTIFSVLIQSQCIRNSIIRLLGDIHIQNCLPFYCKQITSLTGVYGCIIATPTM